MDINEYIDKVYNGKEDWFADECEKSYNVARISDVINNKNYLNGKHKILQKEDFKYKEQEYITTKLVINEAKTIMNFHATYLLGKPLSLVGTENMVKEFEKIYRKGLYNDVDFRLLDKMAKYGDAYEYIYLDGEKIVSKVIDSADGYPTYADDGTYISFIEHWIIDGIYYYNVYYENIVEEWSNEGGELQLINSAKNATGLPIHYHSLSDVDDNFGVSLLKDIMPILNEIEELLSKMGDSIYTLSLNPLLSVIGQAIEGTISADMCGAVISLEAGSDAKYVTAQMDYNTIKLYLDTLGQKLNMISSMPSVIGSSNIANISEVSLKILFALADVQAMLNEKSMIRGLNKRFEVFESILNLQGIKFTEDDYVSVSFNYSRPQNATELLDNLTKQFGMGAISIRSIIEKSPLTGDVQQELSRINEEVVAEPIVDKDTEVINNEKVDDNKIEDKVVM